QIAMAEVDAALIVGVVSGHVVGTDMVIDTGAWPAHRRHHIVAEPQFRDIRPNSLDLAKTFVAKNQEIVPSGRHAIFGGVDLAVGAVDAHTQHLDQDPPAIGNVVERWLWQLGEVHTVGFAWKNGDRLHGFSLLISSYSPLCCNSLATSPVQPV